MPPRIIHICQKQHTNGLVRRKSREGLPGLLAPQLGAVMACREEQPEPCRADHTRTERSGQDLQVGSARNYRLNQSVKKINICVFGMK